MNDITIQNIGPIEQVKIPIPEHGGVIVLKGRNGSGKTHALEAVESVLSGDGKLSVRDGEAVGLVNGLGCVITVGRQTKRAGELEVEEVQSRFNISKLIDPRINEELAADAARMKALLRLLDVDSDPKHFYALVGSKDEFEKVVPIDRLDTSDIVNMAGQVKRFIEAEARKDESIADETAAKIKTITEDVASIDVTQEHNEAFLKSQYETAVNIKSELKARQEANQKAIQNATQAELALQELQGKGYISTVEEAERQLGHDEMRVDSEREIFLAAESKYKDALTDREKSKERLQYAKTVSATIQKWQEMINKVKNVRTIPDEEIKTAEAQVDSANAAISTGVLIRRALSQIEICNREKEKHLAHIAKAEKLRAAAGNIDNVLSSLIKTPKLKVAGGRLVTPTKRSNATFFSELSAGEKWRIAIELTASVVGEGGLMVAEQDAWQDLDEANRKEVAETCKANDVVLLTAQAVNGELTAEVFEPPKQAKPAQRKKS